MAVDGSSKPKAAILYLTACDAHARSKTGTPMVAGKRFKADPGYPALPWGCGPIVNIQTKAPRWLVLADAVCTDTPTGVLVTDAAVVADGAMQDAIRYLHHNGAAGMPYLGRRRRSGDYAVVTIGALGEVEAGDHATVAGAENAHFSLQVGATAAVGREGVAKAAEFARVAGGDLARISVERFSAVVAGTESTVEVGDGGYAVVGAGASCKVGAGGRALIDTGGQLDLGERAVGVGRGSTRFRGKTGATFVALNVVVGEASQVVTAKVGIDVEKDVWYQVKGAHFEKVKL